MVMPMCSDGVTDMFRPNPWNLAAYSADCLLRYGVVSQPHIIETFYGGKDISMHSNILFRFDCNKHSILCILFCFLVTDC